GENLKADTWLQLFKQECERVGITPDKYAETLRLFLEKSALDWFHSCMKNNPLENNWEIYNNSFLETFSVQSWAEITYAYDFKFLNGSLLEYALKKRNLLLEADEDMALNTQINMIVISLPKSIQNKLEKKRLTNIEDLMSKLKQIGHFNEPKKEKPKSQINKTPCPFCEKLGYTNRFHPENVCRLKNQKFCRSKKRIVTPLIKLKVLIDKNPAVALYDSGSNISLLNYEYWEKNNVKQIISGGENIKGVAGVTKSEGTVTLPITIGNITENFSFYIIKSNHFEEDLLLGLDSIKKFKLCQNENLKISQKNEINKNIYPKSTKEKINNNFSTGNQLTLEDILKKNGNVFADSKFDIGITKDYEASIKLIQKKY
ncbi:hypothetical protein PV328_012421, partial [Microctonus aethiopoides]